MATLTLTGPSSGEVSTESTDFTVTLVDGTVTVRVTPSDGGQGGTFDPAFVDLTVAVPAGTFTYTPIWWGPKSISVANDGGLAAPTPVAYLAMIQLGGANVVGDTCPDLGGCPPISTDDPYYQDISAAPVHPDSADLLELWSQDDIGNLWPRVLTSLFHPTHYGTPYCVVPEDQPLVTVAYNVENGYPAYGEATAPIPDDLPLEGIAAGDPYPTAFGTDQHAFIIVRDDTTGGIKETWELYSVYKEAGVWTVSRLAWRYPSDHMYYDRPDGMPTTAAGGTRILPPLVKYDDVFTRGVIDHALRIMVYSMAGAHIPPARAQASGSLTRPPAGTRLRLKADYDISGFTPGCQVILQALKTYGCIIDDGGPNFELTGTRDARWAPYAFRTELNAVDISNMEVLDWGPGYTLSPPGSLTGPVSTPSGEFAVELAAPQQNVGAFAPGGFVPKDYLDATYDPATGWSGDPAGGTWTVNGSSNYRVDLTTASPSAVFRYIPPSGLAEGTEVTLHWLDNTIQRVVPDAVVYTIGEGGEEDPGGGEDPDFVLDETYELLDTFTGDFATALPAHAGELGATWSYHPVTAALLPEGLESYTFYLSGDGAAYSVWDWDAYRQQLLASAVLAGEFDVVAVFIGKGELGDYELGVSFLFHASNETGWRVNYNKQDGGNAWELHSVEAGTPTVRGTYADTIGTGTRTIRVQVRSGGIAVLVDGVERITSEYAVTGAGDRVGLYRRGAYQMGPTTGIHVSTIAAGEPGFAGGEEEPGADLVPGSISITTAATSTTVGLTVTEATGGTGPYTRQWHRSTTTGFTPGVGTAISGATGLTRSETGLSPSTTYHYKVVQADAAAASVTTAQQAVTTSAAPEEPEAYTLLINSPAGGILMLDRTPA